LRGQKIFEEWETYYFLEATQKKANGTAITREYIDDLGRRLYIMISEVVESELSSINEEECID